MWRVVGVRVGLPRHDREVEGVVVKDDAVLELRVRGVAAHEILKRMSQKTRPPSCSTSTLMLAAAT